MLKIYTLIYDFSLCTPVSVGGKVVNVVFSGGCKAINQNGEFSTTDAGLQEALEQDSGFGKVYRLSKEYKNVATQGEEKPMMVAEDLEEKVCATVNEAMEWLVGLGCKKSEVLTSAKAIVAAQKLGYALRFEKEERL